MTKLSVNLNKVALLRNQRNIGIPSVTRAAQICIDAGAHGITVHPRPDQRHTRHSDVFELAELTAGVVEFNIEGNPFEGLLELVRKARPTQCSLVPDAPDAVTSDQGWDLVKQGDELGPVLKELRDLGVRSSLFMDAVPEQMARARELGADRIELYTEPYATAHREGRAAPVLKRYADAARSAQQAGLGVNAGHDLSLHNLGDFCAAVPDVLEVSIGHALTAEALEMGLDGTVRSYLRILGAGIA